MNKKEFLKSIDGQKINIYLQPIVSLPEEITVGYEALARGPVGSEVFSAENLFEAAKTYGMINKLELLCVQKAVELAEKMPGRYWTAINVGPDLFSDIIFSKTVQKLNKNGLIERVVFELTERAPFTAARLLPVVEKLKKIGLTLSLDDMGCGFIDMETVRILRPAIVKLCITITDTIRINEETEKMIKGLLKRVRGYGGVLLAEGVKRAEQIEMLKSCGVPLAQGSYYAQPRPANKIL